jgi:hypothetical protein
MTDSITIGARSGGVCILNAATALRETVFAAADSVGCGKYVPKQAATTTTLSLAMREVGNTLYGKRRKQPIVARHIDGDSFECVRVVAHGDRNEYHHLFSASIDKQWNVTVLAHNHDQQGYMLGQCLTNSVVRLRDYLPSPVVSQVAVNILMEGCAAQGRWRRVVLGRRAPRQVPHARRWPASWWRWPQLHTDHVPHRRQP